MIRSCNDVKTIKDFDEFYDVRYNAREMGLKETADIICWDEDNIICPELLESLESWNWKIRDD